MVKYDLWNLETKKGAWLTQAPLLQKGEDHMASMTALKVALGRMAFSAFVLSGRK